MRLVLLHSLVHLLQQLGTECTRWYWLHSLVHLLQQLGTEWTRWYWLDRLLQQLVTDYRVYRLVLGTQPCTLASITGYRIYRLVLATQPSSTSAYRVYRLVLATQPSSTTAYRVYRLVLATQPCTLASTYRLQSILTGCWLHSPYSTVLHPNWLHIKKKIKKSLRNIDQ